MNHYISIIHMFPKFKVKFITRGFNYAAVLVIGPIQKTFYKVDNACQICK